MVGQYLSNKNEIATVAKSEIFSEINKALASAAQLSLACRNAACMAPFSLAYKALKGVSAVIL